VLCCAVRVLYPAACGYRWCALRRRAKGGAAAARALRGCTAQHGVAHPLAAGIISGPELKAQLLGGVRGQGHAAAKTTRCMVASALPGLGVAQAMAGRWGACQGLPWPALCDAYS